jgi:cell division protein FtsQ
VSEDINILFSKTIYKNICENIEIKGIDRANLVKIQENIFDFCNLKNKNDLNILLKNIKNDPWIKEINIIRKIPNTIIINIKEHSPFVIYRTKNDILLLNEVGETIRIDENEKVKYYNLPVISGKNSIENIYGLFNLLSLNPDLFLKVRFISRIGDRRWNFELDDKITIKMPENNIIDAWNKLNKILSIKGYDTNLKTIDLRNKEKIFLEYNY